MAEDTTRTEVDRTAIITEDILRGGSFDYKLYNILQASTGGEDTPIKQQQSELDRILKDQSHILYDITRKNLNRPMEDMHNQDDSPENTQRLGFKRPPSRDLESEESKIAKISDQDEKQWNPFYSPKKVKLIEPEEGGEIPLGPPTLIYQDQKDDKWTNLQNFLQESINLESVDEEDYTAIVSPDVEQEEYEESQEEEESSLWEEGWEEVVSTTSSEESIQNVVARVEKREKYLRDKLVPTEDTQDKVFYSQISAKFRIPKILFNNIPKACVALLKELVTNEQKLSEYTDFFHCPSEMWESHTFYIKLFRQIVATVYTTIFGEGVTKLILLQEIMNGRVSLQKSIINDESGTRTNLCAFCGKDHKGGVPYNLAIKDPANIKHDPTEFNLGRECYKLIKYLISLYEILHSISILPQTEYCILSTYASIQSISRKILNMCDRALPVTEK